MNQNRPIDDSVYLSVIEQTPASVIILNSDGKVKYVNPFFCKVTGYSPSDVIGNTPGFLKSPHHSEAFYSELWNTIRAGKIWKGELMNTKKDGELFYEQVTISPKKNTQGEISHFIAVKQNIYSDKEEIKSAGRRERILNDIQSLSKTGGWEYDVKTENMYWTDEMYRIHGFTRPFIDDHIKSSIQCYTDKDRPLVEQAFQDCLVHGKDYDLTVGFTDVNGNEKWLRTKTSAIKDEKGNVEKILGAVKDVTEEVGYERALKAGENKLREVVQSFDDIVVMYDTDGRHSEIYGKWADQQLRDLLIGKTAVEALGEEEGEVHRQAFVEALEKGSVTYKWTYSVADGTVIYYQMKLSRVKNSEGELTGFLGVSRNITHEVEVANHLKVTKQRLMHALEGTQAGMWIWDITDNSIQIDERWAGLLGYKKEELVPCTISTWQKLIHPDDQKEVFKRAQKVIEGNEGQQLETQFRMKHKQGHWVWILSRAKVSERDENNRAIYLTGTHIDISMRMHAEQDKLKSEKQYHDLFTKSSDANLLIKDDIIIDCNRAAVRLLGYGNKASLIGKGPMDFSPEKQPDGRKSIEVHQKNIERLENRNSITFDWYLQRKKGEIFPVDVVITPITVAEEKQAMYVVLRDITVRVKAEEALKNSLREKSALLSEVHHRVKNNLAVISGLMQLQVYKSNSDENTKVLNKSINRIRSIALIHEQLYATENFSRLLLNDHIEKQVNYIQELFKAQEEKNIRIQLNLNDVHININQALPVGLMVNEILTNAFKYAFRDRNEGTIEINLKREGGYIDIAIKDDGVGVKGEISKDKSLGVNLIEIFAEQLEASMDIDTQSGVSYHIRFKEREVSGSIESQYMA